MEAAVQVTMRRGRVTGLVDVNESSAEARFDGLIAGVVPEQGRCG